MMDAGSSSTPAPARAAAQAAGRGTPAESDAYRDGDADPLQGDGRRHDRKAARHGAPAEHGEGASGAEAGHRDDAAPAAPRAGAEVARADLADTHDDARDDENEDGSGWSWSFGHLVRRASDVLGTSGAQGVHEHEDSDLAHLGPAFSESTDAERRMVGNILRLRDLRVADVMTPRADIVSVAEDADLATVMAAFTGAFLSRLPVYRETLDDPIGFVHLKDLALTYGVGCAGEVKDFTLAPHIRTALFVPPSMRIAALLQKMQGSRVHMALVIDEFGGVDGLVTIEDLVEQIVGDIEDEHDEDEAALWREEAPGVWTVSARADIAEFEAATGLRLTPEDWDEDADTLGGLVFTLTGRVPVRAEVIAHPAGHEFQVLDADPRRIKRLRLTAAGASSGSISAAAPPGE